MFDFCVSPLLIFYILHFVIFTISANLLFRLIILYSIISDISSISYFILFFLLAWIAVYGQTPSSPALRGPSRGTQNRVKIRVQIWQNFADFSGGGTNF